MSEHGVPNHFLEGKFVARVDECGPDGRVRISSIVNYHQEMAWRHAEILGYGRQALLTTNRAWVLTRMRLVLSRALGPGETLQIRTWPSGRDKYLAYRDFVAWSDDGEEVCRCTTAWAHMDVTKRKMVSLHETAPFPKDADRSLTFTTRTIPKVREGTHSVAIVSRQSDLDLNGHVNNVHFVEWGMESVPRFWHETHFFCEMDITFRHECLSNEDITSSCVLDETKSSVLHVVKRDIDGVELARMHSIWRR